MSSQICYTPDGTSRNALVGQPDGHWYAPCNTTASVSMCCAIGPGRAGEGSGDICLDNGLCQNDLVGDKTTIWRESCTDPTWRDPACIKLFMNGTGFGEATNAISGVNTTLTNGNDVAVTPCDDGSWCSGDSNRECCQSGQGVFIVNGEQVLSPPSQTSSTTPASTTSLLPTNPSNGLATPVKAGIGIAVGLVALILLFLFFWLIRRKKRQHSEAYSHPPTKYWSNTTSNFNSHSSRNSTPGLGLLTSRAELSGSLESNYVRPRAELPITDEKGALRNTNAKGRVFRDYKDKPLPQIHPVEMPG